MPQERNYKANHRIGVLFEELKGNTTALKQEFSKVYGMDIDKVHRYASGSKKYLDSKDALHFLTFFNQKRHPKINQYELIDLFETNDSELKSDLKLSKKL